MANPIKDITEEQPTEVTTEVSQSLTNAISKIKADLPEKLEEPKDLTINDIMKIQRQRDADAKEKEEVEMSLTEDEENNSNTFKTPKQIISPSKQNSKSPIINKLLSMEKFQICSMGHQQLMSTISLQKQSQITQAATILKFSNNDYQCEIMILSDETDDVSLKCWQGSRLNETLSVVKLNYFLNGGFIFSPKNKAQMILIQPLSMNAEYSCPKNYNSSSDEPSSSLLNDDEQNDQTGLSSLTF